MREFLARNEIEHRFVDVRKKPIGPKEMLALVRGHRRALSKVGGKLQSVDPRTATDPELERLFLGREGWMRAPVVSDGETIVAGYDAASFEALVGG